MSILAVTSDPGPALACLAALAACLGVILRA